MNTDTKALGDLYPDSEVFVTRQENRVRYGVVTRKLYKVGNNERVNALLLAGFVDNAEPQFDVFRERQALLIRRLPAT